MIRSVPKYSGACPQRVPELFYIRCSGRPGRQPAPLIFIAGWFKIEPVLLI